MVTSNMHQHSTGCAIRGTFESLTVRDHERRDALIAIALTSDADAETRCKVALAILFSATGDEPIPLM
ncbi:hypothetical protein [Xylanimonas protaetiae]|uniref:Uncharacterized protein n=1 Tax=Xylanimonas protaetiae TaxID=2509457 RepID=A0A4P6F363_9MICO|nr:hypothetical protein [Xylanimonas protaetiae]QAY70022.1 hypothetical protein ET471_08230 [Xylanimonas protaetiae]